MAGQRAGIFLLGGLVLAVVGGGLFLALSQPDAPGEPDVADGDAPPAAESTPTDETAAGKSRRRSGKQGTASVIGVVQRGSDKEPAPGQTVTLSREGVDTLTATTDEKGAFGFEKLAAGGPYDLSVVADGFAPVRLPGIALDRRETRDVGTLVLDKAMRVTVFVKNLDDTPVVGAEVSAFASTTGVGVDWSKRMAQIGVEPVAVDGAVTDEQGKAVFTDLAVGTWTLTARKEGLGKAGKTVRGKSGEEGPEAITIYLSRSFTVVGKVTDHKGNPFPEALVLGMANANAWSPTAAPLHARAVADENGEYELASLSRGDVAVWVARPGGVPSMFATVRVPDIERFDMVLVLGGTLEGTITEQGSGEPIVEATVRAQSWNGFSSRIAEAVTDESGHYSIDTLLEGTVNSITVEKEGYVQVREPGQQQWQQLPLNRDDTVTRDIQLRKAAIVSGTVSGPDGPLQGAQVNAYANAGMAGFQNKTTTTDAKGEYRFAGMDSGEALLVVNAKGHYQKGMPAQWWQALQQGTAPEEFTLEVPENGEVTKDVVLDAGAVVVGRVEAADGTALGGATVRSGAVTTKTAEDGSFRLEGVKPAPQASISAATEGYASSTERIAIAEGAEPEEVVIQMVRTGKVRGRITATGSGELVDAFVQIGPFTGNKPSQSWPPQSPDARWANVEKAPVLSDGTYEIDMKLGAGKFVVRASALGFESTLSEPQDVVPGQDWYEVDVMLGLGATLRGRVTDAGTGAGIAGALVRLGGGGAQQMYWAGMNNMNRVHPIVAVTAHDGTYEVEHVTKGSYTVSTQAEGYIDGTQKIAVPPKGAVDLKLQPELEIRGVVKMKDGTPVQGLQVVASKAGNNQQNFGWNPNQSITGSDGSFRLGGLSKGNFTLQVSAPWNTAVNVKPTSHGPVAAGASDVVVTVEAGLVIAGQIVTAEGDPIPTVWLNAQPEGSAPGMWRNSQSDKNGKFRILGLKEGTYTVHVQTSWGGASKYQATQKKGVRAGTEDLRIELAEGYEIEGRVVDDQNKPVANLQITAQRIREEGESQPGFSGWANTSTDAEGNFTVRGLSPGHYRLNGQSSSTAGPIRTTSNESGGRVLLGGGRLAAGTKDVRLTYAEGARIEGSVVDEAGKPVSGASVNAMPGRQGAFAKAGATDENGHFVIKGLQPDLEYSLVGQHNQYQQSTVTNVRAGTTNVRLVLAAGVRIRGTLLDVDGKGAGQKPIMFTLQKEGGGTGGNSMATTRADGTFEKAGLEEGRYKLQVWELNQSEDGTMRSGTWLDLGEVDAPADDVTLRMPRKD